MNQLLLTLMIQLPTMVIFGTLMFMIMKFNKLPHANREKIQTVFFGDTKEEVKLKMGESDKNFFDVANPIKRESFKSNDKAYEVWYYSTNRIGTKSWEDEVTPVVFNAERVKAIGWKSLKQLGFISATRTL